MGGIFIENIEQMVTHLHLGQTGFKNGAASSVTYPTASGWGAFKQFQDLTKKIGQILTTTHTNGVNQHLQTLKQLTLMYLQHQELIM
jgi:hypothetical protein